MYELYFICENEGKISDYSYLHVHLRHIIGEKLTCFKLHHRTSDRNALRLCHIGGNHLAIS